jgi:hypothetical protein
MMPMSIVVSVGGVAATTPRGGGFFRGEVAGRRGAAMLRLVADAEPKPLRVDAVRNQERILAAAREAFAEQGLDVGVQD